MKQALLEQLERGYGSPDGNICQACVIDELLKGWIEEAAKANQCSFCGTQSNDPIAAPFADFVGHVLTGIRFYWNHPDDEGIAFESAEGGYMASISDNSDVVWGLGVSDRTNVVEKLISSIDDNGWVTRGFYAGNEGDWLESGWDRFKEMIKHHSRFFFLRPDENAHHFGPEVEPHEMLDTIASVVVDKLAEYELVTTMTTNAELFRIRLDDKEKHTSASALGAPPAEFATQSNRMSPAGVPMFYGAFDIATAMAETFDSEISDDVIASVGTFKPVRELHILDLANLPEIPSIYDAERNYLIHSLGFLHSFANDLAKPIKRDGREHVEYVPTQIVTEYFRRVFRFESETIDGIAYRSSKAKDASAFVLFCENEQCIDGDAPDGSDEMLKLVEVSHIRAKDLTPV